MSTATKKRQKTVFKNDLEVAHVWAQQIQNDGKTPSRNCYFERETIFSYGGHFPMATFTNKELNGQRVVLVTNRSYSVTTSGHQNSVQNALRGLEVCQIRCQDVTAHSSRDHRDNLEKLWQDLRVLAANHVKARTYDFTGAMRSKLENIALYTQFAKIGRTKQLAELLNAARENAPGWWAALADLESAEAIAKDAKRFMAIATGEERKRQANERAEKRQRRESELANLLHPMAIDAWRNGVDKVQFSAAMLADYSDIIGDKDSASVRGLIQRSDVPTMLRVNGDTVETSRGASVSVREARVAWKALSKRQIPVDRIGHYMATAFDGDTLVIGCHRIAFSELQNIATQLGLSA